MQAWSRHQYAEITPDQEVETWLGCDRSTFEFIGGVPVRVEIDNPEGAFTSGYHDPEVQPAAVRPRLMSYPSRHARCESPNSPLPDGFTMLIACGLIRAIRGKCRSMPRIRRP